MCPLAISLIQCSGNAHVKMKNKVFILLFFFFWVYLMLQRDGQPRYSQEVKDDIESLVYGADCNNTDDIGSDTEDSTNVETTTTDDDAELPPTHMPSDFIAGKICERTKYRKHTIILIKVS